MAYFLHSTLIIISRKPSVVRVKVIVKQKAPQLFAVLKIFLFWFFKKDNFNAIHPMQRYYKLSPAKFNKDRLFNGNDAPFRILMGESANKKGFWGYS